MHVFTDGTNNEAAGCTLIDLRCKNQSRLSLNMKVHNTFEEGLEAALVALSILSRYPFTRA
jgi:hypothetical protein